MKPQLRYQSEAELHSSCHSHELETTCRVMQCIKSNVLTSLRHFSASVQANLYKEVSN